MKRREVAVINGFAVMIKSGGTTVLRLLVLSLTVLSFSSYARFPKSDASQLGKTLTPLGAERAGSQTGIPSWSDTPPSSDELAEIYQQSPLFVIRHDNYEAHKSLLSEGQIALLEAYPETFFMPVFQSHRTHHVPDYIYEATRKNASEAQLIDDGHGISNVWQGTPFPMPTSAKEVLWNHLVSWRGLLLELRFTEALVYANKTATLIHSVADISMPYYDPSRDVYQGNHVKTYYLTRTVFPPQLAGGALLVHDTLNLRSDPRRAWAYMAQQRRVRRMPSLEHDTPNPNSGHVRVVDEVDIFNGTPERYEWTLLGKQEMLIPYNNEHLSKIENSSLTQLHHIKMDQTRFERHRVWVIEGNLKISENHLYKRRRLYIDEDSWLAVMAEQFDHNNTLWRASLSFTKYYPDMPGVLKVVDAYHDLKTGDHFAQAIIDSEKSAVIFHDGLPKKSDFMPSRLRQIGTR